MVPPPSPRLLLLLALAALTPRAAEGAHTPRPHPAVVQALNPKGLRIAVLDTEGQDLVMVNANVNVPLEPKESGQYTQTVTRAADGFWTMLDEEARLRRGDVIFYWAYVSVRGVGSNVVGRHVVDDLIHPNCAPSPTTVNGQPACKGAVIFEDNFDTLNTSVWMHNVQFSGDPDLEFTTYGSNAQNSFARDGLLHLKATVLEDEAELMAPTKLKGCTNSRGGEFCDRHPFTWNILPPTRSAWLTTRPSAFAFKYGRVDVRAKMAAGDWLQSKAYLEPRDYLYGGAPFDSGRLEVVRVRGNADLRKEGDGENQGAALVEMRTGVASCFLVYYDWTVREMPDKLFSDDYHVFSTTWTPREIKFEVDGQTLKTIRLPPGGRLDTEQYRNCKDSAWERGTAMAPFDEEFLMNLGLQVGGYHIYDEQIVSKGHKKPWKDRSPRAALNFWQAREVWQPTWTSDMEVDYVKIWAL